jgi:hypothetical protein
MILARYNPLEIEAALLEAEPVDPPFPPAADRDAWNRVREVLGEEKVAEMIAEGEAAAEAPIPQLLASVYLIFSRTGSRDEYQKPYRERRTMLCSMVLAECLEHEGRFLDPILDLAWAICEESSWILPAHQRRLAILDEPVIALFGAMTGFALAEVVMLLGEELEPLLVRRIREEVDRRLLAPYIARDDWRWMFRQDGSTINNWNGVCNGSVVSAAILLEKDASRLAHMIEKAARSMEYFIAGFDADGGSTEGPSYWSYGFGYYVLLAHLVEHRTGGAISFLTGGPLTDRIKKIASYPLKTRLSPHYVTNFSDCPPQSRLNVPLLIFLSRRLGIPELMRLAAEQPTPGGHGSILGGYGLRKLFWRLDEEVKPFVPNAHDWFSEMEWMIARTDPADDDALVLAAKGGHNAEMHNQNDVGSVIVHYKQESVVTDPGSGLYTRQYFSELRYDPDLHLVNTSFGHAVPVPNGMAQHNGREYAANLIEHSVDEDKLKIEMKGAYPAEAGLESLVRTVQLHREGAGWVEIVDEVAFEEPGTFESVLTTFGEVEIGEGAVTLTGERGALKVICEPEAITPALKEDDVVMHAGEAETLRRVVFALPGKVKEGTIRLKIEPAD